MAVTSWFSGLAFGLLLAGPVRPLHAQGGLAADGWSGQVQCELRAQMPGYQDLQTHTWVLSGAPPIARAGFRDYPATWTVSGNGSRTPLPGLPGGAGGATTDTWTRSGSDANAYLTIFEPIGTRNLRIAPGQIPLRASAGLAVTTEARVPGGATTPISSSSFDADEWRFPYIDAVPTAGTMSGTRTQARVALVGWRQPAGAPLTETCTWSFTKGAAAPAGGAISRTPNRAPGTRSVAAGAGAPAPNAGPAANAAGAPPTMTAGVVTPPVATLPAPAASGAPTTIAAPTGGSAVRVGASADLSAALVISSANGGATAWTHGEYVTYRLTVRNAGPAAADGASITLATDPTGVSVAKFSVACVAENGGGCGPNVDAVALDAGVVIPMLPSGGSVVMSVDAQVRSRGQNASGQNYLAIVVGTVTAPAGVPDPNPANNATRQTNSVLPIAGGGAADLYTIVETEPGAQTTYWPSPGVAKYVVTVWNSGMSAADGTVLMVPSSMGLSKTSTSCSAFNGAVCPTNLTVNQIEQGVVIPKLPGHDGHVKVTFEANVTAPLGSSVSVTSYVTALPGSGDRYLNDNTSTRTAPILLTSTDTDVDLNRAATPVARGSRIAEPNTAPPTLSAASCNLPGPTLNPPAALPSGVALSWAHINGATYTVSSTDFGLVTPSAVTSATYPGTVSVLHSAPLYSTRQYEYAVVASYGKGCGISRVSVTPPRPFVPTAQARRGDFNEGVQLTWSIPNGVDSSMSRSIGGYLILGPGLPAEGYDHTGSFQTREGNLSRLGPDDIWWLDVATVSAGAHDWLIVPYWNTTAGRSIDTSSGARVTFTVP